MVIVRPPDISIPKFNVSAQWIGQCLFVKRTKFMLPGEGLRVTVGLREYRYEDETFEFTFKALIHIVRFQQAIVWICVEVD